MHPFIRLPQYPLLICKTCKYACVVREVAAHLLRHHKLLSTKQRKDIVASIAKLPDLIQDQAGLANFELPTQPIEHIPFLEPPRGDGVRCTYKGCAHIVLTVRGIQTHCREAHGWVNPQGRGRQPRSAQPSEVPWTTGVHCQRFFIGRAASGWFEVRIPQAPAKHIYTPLSLPSTSSSAGSGFREEEADHGSLEDQVNRQLLQLPGKFKTNSDAAPDGVDGAANVFASIRSGNKCLKWLQITEWMRYLDPHQHQLLSIVHLISIPTNPPQPNGDLDAKTLLKTLLVSLDRVLARARQSLIQGKLNTFDQHRLNSFIAQRPSRKPLLHDLHESTYRKYARVLQQLLCFVFRVGWLKEGPGLNSKLTGEQTLALIRVIKAANELLQSSGDGLAYDQNQELRSRLDDQLILFLVSLFDHKLYGDIYESLVVGFIAAISIRQEALNESGGISGTRRILCEASETTPKLSALIKMAQLLVAERSLLAVKLDETDAPGKTLEEMQERFMCHSSRSPISWALKLRSYGKAIIDSTTALGEISWSDNREILSYGQMQLPMAGLRDLLVAEVKTAQEQLAQLLLISHEPEDRQSEVPWFSLRSLTDDPSEASPGWNFVNHPKNTMLHGKERWILDRILKDNRLRREFFENQSRAQWRLQAVAHYLSLVDAFLLRLLLLVHITGGQPARGTELLCIQHSNATDGSGHRRNIFIENGLISFVTFYHKGYSLTGSPKIVHRYLPNEVGELIVYYLCFIRPFISQLIHLVGHIPGISMGPHPYLWGEFALSGPLRTWARKEKNISSRKLSEKADRRRQKQEVRSVITGTASGNTIGGPWPTTRLSQVLSESFQQLIGTPVSTQMWRHVAIAISRCHLQQAKFKRDFIEAVTWAWNDDMAAHSTKMAGLTYARGINEAPGHVASAKGKYRRICREWHAFLGFGGHP